MDSFPTISKSVMYATYSYKNTDMKYKLMDEGQLKETSQTMAS